MFYQWLRQVLENLGAALGPPASNEPSKREKELVTRTKEPEAKLVKKDHVLAEVTAELIHVKRVRGALTSRWVPHDIRDTIVDFVRAWSGKTERAGERFIAWLEVPRGKFFD